MNLSTPAGLGRLAWLVTTLASGGALYGCAACGCTLSSDGAMGFWTTSGLRLTLQYDFIDQDQLRSGLRVVTPAQVAALNTPAPGAGQEVEHQTVNRYTTLGLSYAPSADWGFRLLVPYLDRSHGTYGPASNPVSPDQLSSATVTGLGDLKILASYQGLLPDHNLGFQLGVKLPTGDYGGQNASNGPVLGRRPVSFGPAGNSGGMLLDTSLQAGTGSTDLLAGAYCHLPVSEDFSVFGNALFQGAVAERLRQPGSDYRPGNQETLTLGLCDEGNPGLVPQLQINFTHKSADQGGLADTTDTAGTVAYLSPGVNARATASLHLFAFLQLPVYSNLSGYQLFPHWTGTAGLAYRF